MKLVWRIAKILLLTVYGLCGLALVAFLVPATGFEAKSIATGSMRPKIPTGSLVIIHKTPLSQLAVGNVVTYTKTVNPPVTITHRIVAKKSEKGIPYFVTKGDANALSDPPIPGGAVIGKVVLHVPYVGSVASAGRTKIGVILIVVIPGLIIIVDEIVRLVRALNRAPAKNEVKVSDNPPPPQPPAPPTPEAPVVKTTSPRRRPPMDGMRPRQLVMLLLAFVLVGFGVKASYSAATTSAASISNIKLTAAAGGSGGGTPTPSPSPPPTQFPCPPGFVIISETGAGSVNIFKCRSTNLSTVITFNITLLKNINTQSATSGNTSGGGTSGNAGNSNNTTNTVNNSAPTPSPTPSATPAPSHSPSPSPSPSASPHA